MPPLSPAGEQREVEAEHRFDRTEGPRVGFELRAIAVLLAIEEFLAVGSFVAAGLVVNDPAHILRRAEDAIHDVGVRPGSACHADAMLAACFGMRTENPATALVRDRVLQGNADLLGGTLEVTRRNATPLELLCKAAPQRVDARGVPRAQLIIGDALEPAMHDRSEMTRRFSGPRELDLPFLPSLVRRRPLH